ncbi:PREDICTED: similar to predicted protein [Bathycoccus prasinos]|uniref:Uncharacterized protein n=1 Tax=Bathycoccus prasinos TaxID=41875 RepID=K8ENG8_9CHLO|nr:PREDICTED: similar to predicted protein [Bathycoccus prasinos]CCO19509.1 PREDICTED: similar to predicted protein [Bathycoccus prasinos]|eukprot:XP_007509052.1 PREDICTED: similar to predicted protein [Bathycoccus prasinos]
MSSRIIDYSKWDRLKYSSSSEEEEEEDDEGEKEMEIARSGAALEKLSLCSSSSSPLWNGLVLHHKDVFVSHVIPKLNLMDRFFFSKVNTESRGVLEYAGVNVSGLGLIVHECSSILTLEWAWNHIPWGEKFEDGTVRDQAWFCEQVALTNKLEFLKWAREVKQCQWDEETIKAAAAKGNLEMLKYCFSNGCPCDEEESCKHAAYMGRLDCLRFLFTKVNPSRETEEDAALRAVGCGHLEILKYFVEERKISEGVKRACVYFTAKYGRLDCLKYLVEEAKVPLNDWEYIAFARYYEHPDCENYLLEKGSPEPTDEEYAAFAESVRARESQQGNSFH